MRLPSILPKASGFNAALSFFSRFGNPGQLTQEGIKKSIFWHGSAGLIIGFFCTGGALLIKFYLPDNMLACLFAGLTWVSLEAWASKGLHWDGVADLGDAISVSKFKFRIILKDSRLGAFGVLLLFFLISGQIILASLHLAGGNFRLACLTLCLAPAWARLTPVWLGFRQRAYSSQSLGSLICANANAKHFWLACLWGFFCLFFPCLLGLAIWKAALLLISQVCCIKYFQKLAASHGGLSGDFFGCHIEISQFLYLFFSI